MPELRTSRSRHFENEMLVKALRERIENMKKALGHA